MSSKPKLSYFAKYAWLTLAFNILVIIWGVFLRASKSGDGCGKHWLTCHGEVIPSAPELKTVIEFSHRIMSGIDFFVILALVIWAFIEFERHHQVRRFAIISFIFIITEALIGAGLVLTGNTAENLTVARPFWAIGHLLNTFTLLGSLSLTAWLASTGNELTLRNKREIQWGLIVATLGMILVGSSGSLAALSSMLFPIGSLYEGLQQDFSNESHSILRLRLSHPILSVLVSFHLLFLASRLRKKASSNLWVKHLTKSLSLLVSTQLVLGTATLLMLGPIVMKLVHLLLADVIWVIFVLMWAAFLGEKQSH